MNKHKNMSHDHMHHNHMEQNHMHHNMKTDNCDMHNMHENHMQGNHSDMMMHGGHMMHMGNLKRKFWISLILMILILIMSPMMGAKLPFQVTFAGSDYIVAILSTILFVYGGKPFFSGAKGEFSSKKPGMMSLIALGITVAYLYSIYAVLVNNIFTTLGPVNDFFWELSTLIVIMLLGHQIEMSSVSNAGSAVNSLAKLLPDNAHLVDGDNTRDISVNEIKNDQVLLVKSGEKIPADGVVKKGTTFVNESFITGESTKVAKKVDDKVIGGSINHSGSIEILVTGTGNNGYLSKVMQMVQDAQNSKSKSEDLANQVAGYLFYAAIAVALIALVAWLPVQGINFTLPIIVSVLIIACPHALGLAIPLITSRSTSIAATNGLLIRNRTSLEKVNQIKYAFMDKTGTLTAGDFKVNVIQSFKDDFSEDQLLQIAASLEAEYNHPLAKGITDLATSKNIQNLKVDNLQQISGAGLSGIINAQAYKLVSEKYLKNKNLAIPTYTDSPEDTISYLVENNQVVGMIAEGDSIKAGSKAMIDFLKSNGIEPVMLTGDNRKAAKKVAQILNINDYKSELLPENKQEIVKAYQAKGKTIFIGDGINDAPSLNQSDIGVAIGSGTDIAIDSADVVLVNSDPKDVINLLKLAKNARRKVIENLWWGAGYNVVALPVAAGILYPFTGFLLDPMLGAVLMSLSTVIVAINAMTLKIK
ncbi:copper-translocating P-type ATPase [Apilactobacillus xinyiensis]|uniref:copper-translocating P-type ATPase n=1 Tax=Apilactobacillus xinyiensis TaxID=2841032 RepID=UPI00402BE58A